MRGSNLGDDKIKKLEYRIGEIATMLKKTPEERYAEAARRRQGEAMQSDEGYPGKTEQTVALKQDLEAREQMVRRKERELQEKNRIIEQLRLDLQRQQQMIAEVKK